MSDQPVSRGAGPGATQADVPGGEPLFKLLVENMHEGLAVIDEAERIQYCNRSFARLLGYTRAQLMGVRRGELVDQRDLSRAQGEIQKRRQGQAGTYEVTLKAANGGLVTTLVSAVPITDPVEERFKGSFAVFTDITYLKEVERELNQHKAELEARVQQRTAQLSEEVALKEHAKAESERHSAQLAERIKELNCLLGISRIVERRRVTLDQILHGVVDLLPPAWQYPELAGARIRLRNREICSGGFQESPFSQRSAIHVHGVPGGYVEVSYAQATPTLDEGPFLREERNLIDAVAERLGRIIERHEAERELQKSKAELTLRNRISDIFLSSSENQVYSAVLDVVLETTGSAYGIFGYIDEHGNSVCPTMTREIWDQCAVPGKTMIFPRDQWRGNWGQALTEQRTVLSVGTGAVPVGHIPITRALAVPIMHQGVPIGHFNLANKPTDYTREDQTTVEMIAAYVAPILYGRLEREREERLRCAVEEELRKSETLFREYFELGMVGMAITSPEKGWIRVNQRLTEILGYPPEELMAMTWAQITHPEDLEPDEALFEQLLAGEIEAYSLDKRFIHKHGHIVHTSLHVAAVRNADGTVDRVLAHIIDISERHAAEEALRQSNTELEQLAYVASHDLREPLRKISNFTELLARKYAGHIDEKADRYIDYIVDGANRMQQLIDDLLLYSRVGRFDLKQETVDMNAVLDRVLSDLEPEIETSAALIHRTELPSVMADPKRLGQVLQNLIHNAIKFRGDGRPEIHITAELTEGMWIFCVADNGIGIDAYNIDRVFVIFQRLHTREEYPGTGIGLAVCKRILERHGGNIWVNSEPGQGSRFFFSLPASKEA